MLAKRLQQASAAKATFVAVAHANSPYVSVYRWNDGGGFGEKLANPSTLLTAQVSGISFSPDGLVIALAFGASPGHAAYQWSASGFGTKYSDPSTSVSSGGGICFTKNGDKVVTTGASFSTNPFSWSNSTGFGSLQSTNASITGNGTGVDCSPVSNSYVAVASTTNVVFAFDLSTTTATRYNTNLATSAIGRGVAFHPAGGAIACAHEVSPYISVFPWTSPGFGTKYANPASLPSGNCNDVVFNNAGTVLAVAVAVSPYVEAYAWSAGFGSKFSNPSTLPTGAGSGIDFSPSDNAIAVAHSTSPYVTAYAWNGGFGAKYSDPSTLPAGNASYVKFFRMP